MRRRLLNIIAGLSLVVAMAAAILTWRGRTGRSNEEWWRSTFRDSGGKRWSVAAEATGLVLYRPPVTPPGTFAGPPPIPPQPEGNDASKLWLYEDCMEASGIVFAPAGATPDALAAQLRNDQVAWYVAGQGGEPFGGPKTTAHFSPRGDRGSVLQAFAPYYEEPVQQSFSRFYSQFDPNSHVPFILSQAAPCLLDALEDPDRWVAAHVVLARLAARQNRQSPHPTCWKPDGTVTYQPDGTYRHEYAGLVAVLRPADERMIWEGHIMPEATDYHEVRRCRATIAPGQQALLVDSWHRRFAVKWGSVPWWVIAFGLAAPAAIRGGAWFSHRRRRRLRRIKGQCVTCGYDIRMSSDTCPECGQTLGSVHAAKAP